MGAVNSVKWSDGLSLMNAKYVIKLYCIMIIRVILLSAHISRLKPNIMPLVKYYLTIENIQGIFGKNKRKKRFHEQWFHAKSAQGCWMTTRVAKRQWHCKFLQYYAQQCQQKLSTVLMIKVTSTSSWNNKTLIKNNTKLQLTFVLKTVYYLHYIHTSVSNITDITGSFLILISIKLRVQN